MVNSTNPDLSVPPFNVFNRAEIIDRFGADKLALLLEMATSGDRPADDVVAELSKASDDHQHILNAGIRHGHRSLVAPPPSISALLKQAESIPHWVNGLSVQRGSEAYLASGALWMTVAIGPGSLAHTYGSPTISKVLMKTGNLDERTDRRLAETAIWLHHVLRPGGLHQGADGYVHTMQVRMLHARVRATLLKHGWNTTDFGVPISQLDMLRTWLGFTYIPCSALQKIGITFDEHESRELYDLWKLIAHILGIEERFSRYVVDDASAAELLALIDASCAKPDDSCRLLMDKMLTSIGRRLHAALGVHEEVSIQLMHAFCRLFHGDEFADKVEAKRSWVANLLPQIAHFNRCERQLERNNKVLRARKIAQTLDSFDRKIAAMKGETAYQSAIARTFSLELPQVGLSH